MVDDVVSKEPATLATNLSADNEYTTIFSSPQIAVCS